MLIENGIFRFMKFKMLEKGLILKSEKLLIVRKKVR